MAAHGSVVVVGGTRAIGLEIAKHYAGAGRDVILTGQSPENVANAVAEVGGSARGITFDLAQPHEIAAALADVGPVQRLALVAIDRDHNSIADYSIDRAIRLVTLKLVGFTAVVSVLRERLTDDASLVLFGGMAKERPYPGSTTVTTVNGGIVGLTRIAGRRAQTDPRQLDPPRRRRRQPVLGREAGRDRALHLRDADGPPRAHGRDRRRGGVPVREHGRQRGGPDRRRRLAHPLARVARPRARCRRAGTALLGRPGGSSLPISHPRALRPPSDRPFRPEFPPAGKLAVDSPRFRPSETSGPVAWASDPA